MAKSFAPWGRFNTFKSAIYRFVFPWLPLPLLLWVSWQAAAISLPIILWFFMHGQRLHRSIQRRKHGMQVEKVSSRSAEKVLLRHGFNVEKNIMTRYGDVDMVVRKNKRVATIEIKSFRQWRHHFFAQPREKKARQQARRQKKMLQADVALIWLPQGRLNWVGRVLNIVLPERHPLVVCGNVEQLYARLAASHRRFRA